MSKHLLKNKSLFKIFMLVFLFVSNAKFLFSAQVCEDSYAYELLEKYEAMQPAVLRAKFMDLVTLGPSAQPAIKVLIDSLGDERNAESSIIPDDTSVARFAQDALVDLGEMVVPELIADFSQTEKSESERIRAIQVFKRIGIRSINVQSWIETQIVDDSQAIRILAVDSLGFVAEKRERAVRQLERLTLRTDPVIRAAAARGLGALKEASAPVIPQLVKLLDDQTVVPVNISGDMGGLKEVRLFSVIAIREIGVSNSEAEQMLLGFLKDDDFEVQIESALAFATISKKKEIGISHLISMASSTKSPDVSARAIRSLGQLRGAARKALPLVHKSLNHTEPEIRSAAVMALSQIDSIAFMSQQDHIRQDPSEDVRIEAYLQLKEIPIELAMRTEISIEGLSDENWFIKYMAIENLAADGPSATRALPSLRKIVSSEDKKLGRLAKVAIERISSPNN